MALGQAAWPGGVSLDGCSVTQSNMSLLPDEGTDTASAERGAGRSAVFAELLQEAKLRAPHLTPSLVTLPSSRCAMPNNSSLPALEKQVPIRSGLAKQEENLAFHFLLHPFRFSWRFSPLN